jgi:tetratricopeptide (TPR) repeat protein
MRWLALALVVLVALPVQAAGAAKDVQLDRLFASLKAAASPEDAKPVEDQILARFRQSGSPSIDLLMTRADAAFAAGDENTAARLAAAMTRLAPGFAEGWHVRALLQERAGDDKGALASLQKTVGLNPRHFAALAELGDKLSEYGDKDGALKLFRRALQLDPQFEDLRRRVDALTRNVEGQGI